MKKLCHFLTYPKGKSPSKLLLIMKLSTFFIFLCILSVSAREMSSQSAKVSLEVKGKPIADVLADIEEQTDYLFFYNKKDIDVEKTVSASFKNTSVSDVLAKIFSGTDVSYSLVKDYIVLTQNKLVTNSIQQQKLMGTVTDASTGEAVIGANVIIEGTTIGVVTDVDGRFSIDVPGTGAVLVISYLGYVSERIVYTNQTNIQVSLVADIKRLDEVVVIGYGTVKKSDLTGSVSSVKSDQLSSFPVSGAVQALQGRAAGVQISTNNGDPGGSVTVKVRGGTSINASSEPLYVVDGFPGAFLPQPEDIESLEILKDASATAIYGSRGANGVIMITTKKGKKGKVKVEYNTSYSQQKETNRIDLLNAKEFLELTQPYYPNYVSEGQDTDWQDVVLQKGSVQTHQLSLSGGAENVNYYVSGYFFDQKGLIIGSGFNKYSLTSNINVNASKKLMLGVNLFMQRSETDGVLTQEGSGGSTQAGVIGSALRFMPDQGIYQPDGVTYSIAKLGDPIDNPYTILKENTRNIVSDRLQARLSGEYKILNNLTFNSTFGLSSNSDRNGFYASSLTNAARGKGNATMDAGKNSNFITEDYFNYNQTFATVHRLGLMAGYSYAYERRESWGAASNAFLSDAFSYWNMGGGTETPSTATSGLSDEKLSSFYGRLNYSFNEKYLVTFTSRYDGSSKFSKNHKWAFFPSGSFAWNMHRENFMKSVPVISQFKWRVSYGVVGNQAIRSYQTLARLSPVLSVVNGAQVNAVRPTAVANDNLKWESTASTNIGTDIGLFDNRVSLTVDAYKNVTSDLLFSVNLPPYAGIANQIQNVGKVENKGLEFTVFTKNLTGNFIWNSDFNISINRNKILELPDGKDILYNNAPGHWPGFANSRIMREGQPLGSFYGYIYDGVYQEGDVFIPGSGFEQVAGGEKYRDINGKDANGNLTGEADNLLNTNDLTIIGNPNPKFTFGFNNEFRFKGFELVVFINGSQGNDIYSYQLQELENLGAYGYNSTKEALRRWTPTNTNTDVPAKNLSRSLKPSSRWVMDGSYVRLKNIMLGYSFQGPVVQKMRIQNLKVYVSAQNILTLTKYRGYDPEVNYRASNINLGTDYGSYPMAKSLTAGLNIVF